VEATDAEEELHMSELRELKQLRDEKRRLKGLVADLTLDKARPRDALGKHGKREPTPRGPRLGAPGVSGQRAARLPRLGDSPR
jgi:hypothetical protein